LAIAARYHDVGKIMIPKRILNKPGKLTEEEKRHIMVHSKYSSQILEQTGHSKRVVQFAMLHHENFDGSEYPFGYKGDRIPIEARIIRVADVFDALHSKRAYKEALQIDLCLQIMKSDNAVLDDNVLNVLTEQL
jgi:HD-GYP domain-containing protein (c-di-GMP phosphodiesterase class II)